MLFVTVRHYYSQPPTHAFEDSPLREWCPLLRRVMLDERAD